MCFGPGTAANTTAKGGGSEVISGGKIMRALIYAWYFSDNQREESIEYQLRECRKYTVHNDLEIAGVYFD